jgi:hypothetical protein
MSDLLKGRRQAIYISVAIWPKTVRHSATSSNMDRSLKAGIIGPGCSSLSDCRRICPVMDATSLGGLRVADLHLSNFHPTE